MYAKTIIIGRLGKDPELKYVGNEATPICKFSVAAGIGEKDTVWYDVVAWGKQAESCAEHLAKGRTVAVEGSMRVEKYESKDGQQKTHWSLNAVSVRFIDRPSATGAVTAAVAATSATADRHTALLDFGAREAMIEKGLKKSPPGMYNDEDAPF